MKRTAMIVAALLLVASPAAAGPNWHSISLAIPLENNAQVLAALDKLMAANSENLTGTVSLMQNVAGDGPASHVIISAFDTRAAREAWLQTLVASPAWRQYARDTAGMTERVSASRMNFVQSWGDESDKDVFWEIYAFDVEDPEDFVGALNGLMVSETGKKFPGQVHLSSVAAAGMTPVTHLISVGYESEAEAEGWNETMTASKDWTTYVDESEDAADNVGAYMIRSIKTWGNTGNAN